MNKTVLDTIVVKDDVIDHKSRILDKQVIQYVSNDNRFSRYRKVVKDGDSVLVDFADKKMKSFEIVASPSQVIKIKGDAGTYLNAYPEGNKENQLIATFNRNIYPLLDQLGNLDYSDKKNIRVTLRREDVIVDSIFQIEDDFIKGNRSSIISSYLVLNRFVKLNKTKSKAADSLLSCLKPEKGDVYTNIMLALKSSRSKKIFSIGDIFPSFQSAQIYKDSLFKLSSTLGKFVLLDFWGTWCIPCLKEMPRLKLFYEKHKDKLMVIGVAKDAFQSWKSFLDKNKYSWIQVLDQEPLSLASTLNVEVYPTKYMLDRTGKIIMIFKDSDEAIWSKIEHLLESY